MTAALAVHCFGSEPITVSPVRLRQEGNELRLLPGWRSRVAGYRRWHVGDWLPGFEELGAVPVYVDPVSDIALPEETWVEITGQLDHPTAQSCEMTSIEPEAVSVRNAAEAVVMCRGHFVVSAVRELADDESPHVSGRVSGT